MGRIVVSENVTVDGVMEDPTGDAEFRHGGWFNSMTQDERAAWAAHEFAEAQEASALLLGRGSDEYFGSRWNEQTNPWAMRLKELPKYVVSSTLEQAVWINTTVLRGDVVEEITRLTNEVDGDIVVYASRPLVHTLLAHGLVDEVRVIVFPVALGEGGRLFEALPDKVELRPITSRPIGQTLLYISYKVNR